MDILTPKKMINTDGLYLILIQLMKRRERERRSSARKKLPYQIHRIDNHGIIKHKNDRTLACKQMLGILLSHDDRFLIAESLTPYGIHTSEIKPSQMESNRLYKIV